MINKINKNRFDVIDEFTLIPYSNKWNKIKSENKRTTSFQILGKDNKPKLIYYTTEIDLTQEVAIPTSLEGDSTLVELPFKKFEEGIIDFDHITNLYKLSISDIEITDDEANTDYIHEIIIDTVSGSYNFSTNQYKKRNEVFTRLLEIYLDNKYNNIK